MDKTTLQTFWRLSSTVELMGRSFSQIKLFKLIRSWIPPICTTATSTFTELYAGQQISHIGPTIYTLYSSRTSPPAGFLVEKTSRCMAMAMAHSMARARFGTIGIRTERMLRAGPWPWLSSNRITLSYEACELYKPSFGRCWYLHLKILSWPTCMSTIHPTQRLLL